MNDKLDGDSIIFKELQWDTEFFGIQCAKAVLLRPMVRNEWEKLKAKFEPYRFISIENRNSEPTNSQLIGSETSAFLADINIQFSKRPELSQNITDRIKIDKSLEYDDRILELADFKYSKFAEDPNLAKRRGSNVYRQWIINSFGKRDKYFAIDEDEKKGINGFILLSYQDKACVIELIAVSRNMSKKGIGSGLFKAVENEAIKQGFEEVKVGTQLRNIDAINFYHKLGCKMVGCHQIYHLWNS